MSQDLIYPLYCSHMHHVLIWATPISWMRSPIPGWRCQRFKMAKCNMEIKKMAWITGMFPRMPQRDLLSEIRRLAASLLRYVLLQKTLLSFSQETGTRLRRWPCAPALLAIANSFLVMKADGHDKLVDRLLCRLDVNDLRWSCNQSFWKIPVISVCWKVCLIQICLISQFQSY